MASWSRRVNSWMLIWSRGTRCLLWPWEPAEPSWASAGAASALEVPTTAAVAAAVRRKPRRLSRATSSRPAVSS